MLYPPSLPDDLRTRAFRARNDELGILPADAAAFLAACRLDGVKVLGWELWVVDHNWGQASSPVPAIGSWCGGIPVRGYDVLAVVGGEGDADETQKQVASFNFGSEVLPEWLPHIRVNFTLGG
jgi:hypothetical protein